MSKLSSKAYELFLLTILVFVLYSSISEYANGQEATPHTTPSAIDVGSYPVGIEMNPITNRIYVANEYSNTISVIDASTDLVESTIQVENFPMIWTLIDLTTGYMLPTVVLILYPS